MKTPNYVFDDELYHHGIPGQRWGHRRFQNEDGSWTPEGRERYSEGERERFAAKDAYKTQKYKAKLESRAIKDAARRAAKEERYKIRQAAKVESAAKKEQSKLNREQSKLNNKLNRDQAKENDTSTFKNALNRTKKYTMSDNELENAINRLKLEVEYNKQYALASKPNGALARADRFFDGPTGKMVRDIAVATIPKVAETATSKLLESKLKYANKEDREKIAADTEKVRAEARSFNEKAEYQKAQTEHERSKIENERNESESKIKLERSKEAREAWGARAANALAKAADARAAAKAEQDLKNAKGEALSNRLKEREEIKKARIANKVEEMTQFGYDAGSRLSANPNWVAGKVAAEAGKRRAESEINWASLEARKQAAINEANSKFKDEEFKREQAAKDADAIRKISAARYNDASFLTAQGKVKEAERLISMTSSIKIGNAQSTQETKAKYEEVSKKEESKPISSIIDTKTNLNTMLREASNSGLSSNEVSRIHSLLTNHTVEEVAKLTGHSTSTIDKYKRR